MFSTMISRQILSCLLVALLSQYADAKKSQCPEILTSLQRIENIIVKKAEQNSLNYIIPADKLLSLISENLSSNESNEIKPNSVIRRALDLHNDIEQLIPKKYRRKNKNRNANTNTNINENINANYDANRYHRRTFDDNLAHNQNKNTNFNLNSNMNRNREDIFGISAEDVSYKDEV